MSTAGIIAEYNPFHNGHLYQTEQICSTLGCEHIISVMSGDYIQRGLPAVCSKYLRADMAVSNGIDAVFELPMVFATASAGDFAFAGVSLLEKLHAVDYLVFGAECDDVDLLNTIANFLIDEPTEFSDLIRQYITDGNSYPAARAKAFASLLPDAVSVIAEPNNILAIEYLAALKKLNSSIKPYIIKREQAAYNSTDINGTICSASAIRSLIQETNKAEISSNIIDTIKKILPDASASLFLSEYGRSFPVFENDLSALLQYRLLQQTTMPDTADMTPELYNKLRKADTCSCYHDILESAKSKEITQTRINRAILHLLLDVKKTDMEQFKNKGWSFYGHILALRRNGSAVLKKIKENAAFPVFTKTADGIRKLDSVGYKMLSYDITATRIYNHTVYNKFGNKLPDDFTVQTPVR